MLFLIDVKSPYPMKKTYLSLLLPLIMLSLPLQRVNAIEDPVPWLRYLDDKRVDSIINTMTVREMIAQLIWVPAWAGDSENNFRQVEELVVKYGIGGVIFFEGNTAGTDRFYQAPRFRHPDTAHNCPGCRVGNRDAPEGC